MDAESSVCGTGSATANESEGNASAGYGGVRHEEAEQEETAPKLSVAAVARRLGVAPATLRTWDRRYGLGPTEHSSGSHRRYGPGDVARLELMQHALLRGASPAEAARYAHAASARHDARAETGGDAARRGSRRETPPGGLTGDSDGAVLMSGVLDSDEELPEEVVDTANTGGRGLRLAGAAPLARGLGRAVLALDAPAAQRILLESATGEGVAAMRREVLRPVTRALAELRERTGSGAELPKLLEDSVLTVLRSVIANAASPHNPRPVLLATAPGEQQSPEPVALAAALAQGGVGHRLFASALPREGLEAAIRRAAPVAVLVWSEHAVFADPQVLTGLPRPRQRVRTFAAGPGWSPDALPEHVDHLDSWEDALACLEGFAPPESIK